MTRPAVTCEHCLAPRGVNLRYFATKDPETEPGARVVAALEPVRLLRFGRLLRCRHCGAPWYDPDPGQRGLTTSVGDRWLPLLERWDEGPLPPSAQQLFELRAIGALRRSWPADHLRIPCRVRAAGTWHDPVLVQLQNHPLLGWDERPPPSFLMSEVEEIAPSEFALSAELRRRGADAPERAMGWAPHSAYWGAEEVALNGLTEFWGEDGRMGMDLSAARISGAWRPRAASPRLLAGAALSYVVGDLGEQALEWVLSHGR